VRLQRGFTDDRLPAPGLSRDERRTPMSDEKTLVQSLKKDIVE